jgi:hypothetical protein
VTWCLWAGTVWSERRPLLGNGLLKKRFHGNEYAHNRRWTVEGGGRPAEIYLTLPDRTNIVWDRKIWSWIPWDPEPKMTLLVKASSNYPKPETETYSHWSHGAQN